MAKLNNIRQDHTLPALGGRYIVRTWRGKLVLAKWPKKRSKPLPPHTLAQNERFKNANLLAKYAPESQQTMALKLAEEGPLYPRDYITAAMTSGLFQIQLGPNRKVFPVSQRNEVSYELDIIQQQAGGMMGRGPDFWEPVGPGGIYSVPCLVTPGQAPVMVQPGPEVGGHSISGLQRTTENAGTTAAKGIHYELQRSIQVVSVVPSFNSVNGATYKCEIWEWDGTKLTEKKAESSAVVWTGTAFFRRQFPMLELVTLEAGKKYVNIFIRTDATGTTNNKTFSSGDSGNGGYPSSDAIGWAQWQKTSLAVNDVPASSGFSVPFCIDMIFKM